LGVIKGLAEHYGLPTWLLRVLTIALAAMVTFWPVVIVYVLVAIFMPLRPMGSRVF
jgi:phage shock protein PspC (stress-responsive transcriptional regulator)